MAMTWQLIKATASRWNSHNAPRMGAALAYYTVLSMAPLLVLTVAICGWIFGQQAVQGQIVWQVSSLVGPEVAKIIQDLLKNAHHPESGILATVGGLFTLLLGASAVFGELRDALNLIWSAKQTQSGWRGMIRFRIFSFALVLSVGFLLLTSLIISAVLAYLEQYVNGRFYIPPVVPKLVEPSVSLTIVILLFAMIYKFIPDVFVSWKDVWIGATFTSVMFTLGKSALSLYLGKASIGSAYGAAGSLVILLVWVYYSSQIFFFGAEFTKVYADWRMEKLASAAV